MENTFPADPTHTAPTEPHAAPESPVPDAPAFSAGNVQDAHSAEEPAAGHTQEVSEEAEYESNSEHGSVHEPGHDATEAHPEDHASDNEPGVDAPEGASSPEAEAQPEEGSLEELAARARKGRLNSEEETEACLLLKESLLGGRAEVARAVAVTPSLPWVVSVHATTTAWPEMKPSFRTQFLAGLARTQGEPAARVRLSLARGLFKVDQTAALKLILLTLKVIRDKQTGLLEGKGAALFANVLIGRGKAWVLQLPLQELKPAEADLLVFAALHGAFHAPQAPVAQLSILKWAAADERLTRIPDALAQLILKGVSRWSGKWQAALRKEVTPVPESWAEVLKAPTQKRTPEARPPQPTKPEVEADEESSETSEDENDDPQLGDRAHPGADRTDSGDPDLDPDADEEDADDEDEDREEQEDRPRDQKQRPVYVSKTIPNQNAHQQGGNQGRRGNTPPHFNLQDSLRQIDSYVAGLRNELQAAQKQLRQREEDPRRGRRGERPAPMVAPGEHSLEELTRLNQQLESRNAELKLRIDELTIDSEERAASSGLISGTPPPDADTQLRTLLGFKLKDDFEDFLALQQEARDLVVQQHYRTVLQHVFDVLRMEGVQLTHQEKPHTEESR